MILTKLVYGKDGLFQIYIDEEPACKIDDETVYREKLKEGMELSQELFEKLFERSAFVTVRKDCTRLLSRKSYTKKELRRKLKEKGHSDSAIDKAFVLLEENGLLDDMEYAKNYIRESVECKKLGRYKIAYQLKLKGISDEIIQQLMEEEMPPEEDHVREWVEKFAFGVARDDRKQLDKIRRRLYGKGFSIDRINAAIEEYFAEHEEESDFEM